MNHFFILEYYIIVRLVVTYYNDLLPMTRIIAKTYIANHSSLFKAQDDMISCHVDNPINCRDLSCQTVWLRRVARQRGMENKKVIMSSAGRKNTQQKTWTPLRARMLLAQDRTRLLRTFCHLGVNDSEPSQPS